jgi:hypothetical protein
MLAVLGYLLKKSIRKELLKITLITWKDMVDESVT